MVRITQKGSFKSTQQFFSNAKALPSKLRPLLEKYGKQGVIALENATPQDTGLTSKSWSYTVENWGLAFYNSNLSQNISVAILIQYGHVTGTGGYVAPRDFINPALNPIFDKLLSDMTKEMHSL